MSRGTNIEWCTTSWPVTAGCDYASPGCAHCWAVRDSWRLSHNPNPKVSAPYAGTVDKRNDTLRWTGLVRELPGRLALPLRWRKPERIFVGSQSDLFHEDVSDEFIAAVFGVAAACPRHQFLILTKRAERMRRWFEWVDAEGAKYHAGIPGKLDGCARAGWGGWGGPPLGSIVGRPWPLPNVWLGCSAEDQPRLDERWPHLRDTPAAARFLSLEPLIAPVDVTQAVRRFCGCGYPGSPCDEWQETGNCGNRPPRADWIIAGGESGSGARPCDVAWIRSVVEQCASASVPCFTKQMGAHSIARCDDDLSEEMYRDIDASEDGHPGYPLRVPYSDRKGGDMSEFPADLRVRQMPEVPR